MKIPNEQKAQIFARYPFHRVSYGNFKRKLLGITFDDVCAFSVELNDGLRMYEYFKDHPNAALLLTTMSEITDEDATEIARILKPHDEHTHNGEYGKMYVRELFKGTMQTAEKHLTVFQYLMLKGYAIPQTVIIDDKCVTFSIDELVQEKIFKLIQS